MKCLTTHAVKDKLLQFGNFGECAATRAKAGVASVVLFLCPACRYNSLADPRKQKVAIESLDCLSWLRPDVIAFLMRDVA